MAFSELVEKRLIEYMKIDSTTGTEEIFAEAVCKDLEANNWTVKKQKISDKSSRFNVLATYKDATVKDVKLLFNTHLDTVPPFIPPTQDEKNIYGRGSNDAKGQLSCMVTAANAIAEENSELARRIGLLFVVGEEVDHVGMEAANDLELHPDYLIVGEPTELKFGTIQKGALKVRLTAAGIAGHSGYLDSGKSAIHNMVAVLNDLMKFNWPNDEKLGETTYNIGKISGGQALNAWAEKCEADVFIRVTTSVEHVKQLLTDIVKERAELEYLSWNDPVVLDSPPFEAPMTQVAFNTDLPYFRNRDLLKGRYLFGAGSIRNAHSQNEFMPKNELHSCVESLIQLAKLLQ